MATIIETTDGSLVFEYKGDTDPAQVESSVKERNERAEKLGIKARYRIRAA